MKELLEEIKSACDHSWGLFFIFLVSASTCNTTDQIKHELQKTNSYLEQLVNQKKGNAPTVKSIKADTLKKSGN